MNNDRPICIATLILFATFVPALAAEPTVESTIDYFKQQFGVEHE